MSISDNERAFYDKVMGNPDNATLADLRKAFYLAVVDESLTLGGGGGQTIAEVTGLQAALDTKMPQASGSINSFLKRTNSVVGAGATYAWSALPDRAGGVLIMSGAAAANPVNYVIGDAWLQSTTGRIWVRSTDGEGDPVWEPFVRFTPVAF